MAIVYSIRGTDAGDLMWNVYEDGVTHLGTLRQLRTGDWQAVHPWYAPKGRYYGTKHGAGRYLLRRYKAHLSRVKK
jgi:hypothetical protein